jgi:small-conductance mechanosensitive channel
VKNWSRGSDFSLMTIDFLLTHQSNIEKAKQLLLDLTRENRKLYDESHTELNAFKNTYKYGDEDLDSQIHVVSDPRGIILRVRVLVHVQDKLREESRIMEEFSAIIQKQKDIAFRTV